VILLTPYEKREYQKGVNDLFEYYGVGRHFEIKKLLIIKKRGLAQIYDSVDLLQYQHCSNYSFWRFENCELAKQGNNLP